MNLPSPTSNHCNESRDSYSGHWDISHLSSPTMNLPSPTSSDMDILFSSPEIGGVLEIQSILGRPCKKRVEEFDTLQPSKKRKLLWDSPVKDEICGSINNNTKEYVNLRIFKHFCFYFGLPLKSMTNIIYKECSVLL